ncbi:hypothetical protein [Flavobacterium johnsoniae]|uniref:Uncharacterized protein n=1 Tax=Flavobacterium johnsoniae (strain ATCC 17061 / DSM 2064 / JCM 8514 / BCRC 14874 / CCUG 350202 / NBRC 14942 / NCIMB 11054 / UW101) TaxID=376686 RepID=A5FFS4_FLAJ1|nr:hypothetical protein [Flavobacterium johnsoniae]ABQ05944.1 hypothetical protein Fjoh_2923 [Flavobacterium johnsoniae UW101]OXE95491.1 hypothetical protein B0A63_24035 [Flavobacterium johnsoniae UW101]WQG81681.1 hypothetical protein SR927_00985 [Flavobacterium johnsoniae UW101]
MSKLLCNLIFLVSLSVFGQSEKLVRKNDKKLVGYWKGADFDNVKFIQKKYWTINREENGNYFIVFTSFIDCEVKVWNERGTWWTDNGKYFQLDSRTHNLTSINYSLININEMFFSKKPSDAKVENNDVYYFEGLIDY